jgi:hypothetical protein
MDSFQIEKKPGVPELDEILAKVEGWLPFSSSHTKLSILRILPPMHRISVFDWRISGCFGRELSHPNFEPAEE